MEHPFGAWSLVPPLLAIVLAMATRRVVMSLAAGIWAGSLIVWRGNPLIALADTLEIRLWRNLINEELLRVFAFTLLMGAMVGVVHRGGGMHGVVDVISRWAKNRTRGQLTTWFLGLLVFFDDYANTLLLGGTMRPLSDRLRISREKLAYVVDSTAAPVAGLALISTWVAGEIGYIGEGLEQLGLGDNVPTAFTLFVQSIPYRFYVLYALLFVPLVAILRRDFGAMLTAERRAASGRVAEWQSTMNHVNDPATNELSAADASLRRWYNAVIPIVIVLGVVLSLLLATGASELGLTSWANLQESIRGNDISWWQLFGNGDSYLALVYASLAGLLAANLLVWTQRILSIAEIKQAAIAGARAMVPALMILWLAKCLADVTGSFDPQADHISKLGSAEYLGTLLYDAESGTANVSAGWMPTVVFLLASAVAFSTGTSWGTMGILMPLAIQVTYRLLSVNSGETSADVEHPIMIAAIGSVLAGAIFGDHCSPISDTTVLSSQASGCDHMAHVWTQIPYALFVATIAVICGTLPIGWGISVWPVLGTGAALLVIGLLLMGRTVEEV